MIRLVGRGVARFVAVAADVLAGVGVAVVAVVVGVGGGATQAGSARSVPITVSTASASTVRSTHGRCRRAGR